MSQTQAFRSIAGVAILFGALVCMQTANANILGGDGGDPQQSLKKVSLIEKDSKGPSKGGDGSDPRGGNLGGDGSDPRNR